MGEAIAGCLVVLFDGGETATLEDPLRQDELPVLWECGEEQVAAHDGRKTWLFVRDGDRWCVLEFLYAIALTVLTCT